MRCRVALTTCILIGVFAVSVAWAKSLKHGDKVRMADTEAGREAESAGINCPSITEDFRPSSSIKCDGCHVTAVSLTYRLVRERQMLAEAVEGLCEDMMNALLRQKVNGRRFWVPPHKNRGEAADEVDKIDAEAENATTITLTGMDATMGSAPTYHDDFEQRVLPCAPFLLKRLCFARVEEAEEGIETCVAKHRVKPTKKAGAVVRLDVKPNSEAEEELLNCLSTALGCQSGDCFERAVLREREAERIRFLKFEGAFGNQQVQLVEDEFTPGLMVKNPYAPGGEKAKYNELLKKKKKATPSSDL